VDLSQNLVRNFAVATFPHGIGAAVRPLLHRRRALHALDGFVLARFLDRNL
jgi:hypothetical protein